VETAQIVKARLLLNVALLGALLGLALYAYLRPADEGSPETRITQLGREQIDRVRIERRNSPDIDMEKRNGNWHMLEPYRTRVEQLQIDRVLDLSAATASEQLAGENLSRYGLDPAALRVTLNDQAFAFGNINEVTNEQYLGSGDSVYLVRTYFGYGMPINATKLLSHKLLGEDEIPVVFDFGDWQAVKNEKGGWSIQRESTAPDGGDTLSADTLNLWVAEWQLASSLSATPHEGSASGERIVIQFSNGNSATIRVLSRDADVLLLRLGESMRYQLGAEAGGRLLDPYRVAGQ
jgi:hypothetical protein